ncbi:ribonuclease H-like YkuK family protein [Sutcliffiella deserti]|uniref:ribonuclease H-like YkuK family protein n=1 Tax=Sutcliffiella deserti TaxID=2875501 RepID=UPI001CBB3545|nr:ribonuclease H-like YkuK family protein [Sutcliffiella deserti]
MDNTNKFYNITHGYLTFEQAYMKIFSFIEKDVKASYLLSIGTDSHTYPKETKFMTAIHLHRIGKGAWGCIRPYVAKRAIRSLHEKISLETALSQEVAMLFTNERLDIIQNLLIPYLDQGADFRFEIHLDIGQKGATRDFIQEMTGRITAMGFDAKIKPDAYAAFCYAHRYTK